MLNLETILVIVACSCMIILNVVGVAIILYTQAKANTTLIERLSLVGSYLQSLSSSESEPRPKTFMTPDGKYQSSSLPGLIKQMIDDPNNNLDEDQMDQLKKMFERMVNEDDADDEDDPRGF